jgi:hypothetical protein
VYEETLFVFYCFVFLIVLLKVCIIITATNLFFGLLDVVTLVALKLLNCCIILKTELFYRSLRLVLVDFNLLHLFVLYCDYLVRVCVII